MRLRLVVLPAVAAAFIFACLFMLAQDARGAELVGPGAAWARGVSYHAPGPAGPPITILIEPTYVDGKAAGGSWSGWSSTLRVSTTDLFSLGHELGHAFDDRNLSDGERLVLLAAMDYPPGTPWDNQARWSTDVFCEHLACPNERFADLYALCALGYRPYRLNARYVIIENRKTGEAWWDGKTTAAQLGRTCRLITQFA